MDKRFFAIIVVIILAFVGVAMFTGDKDDKNNANSAKVSTHTKGGDDATVTLVEYGDFQCPACEQYYPVVNQVIEHYGDKIKFQFRNYPLVSLHPNAWNAARAAEAAGLQGKYWEMHDRLYEQVNWTAWTTANNPQTYFDSYAKGLGLDVDKFKADSKASVTNDIVLADKAAGDKIGVTATPTFVLNGKKQANIGASLEAFKAVIDPELAKANKKD